MYIGSPLFEYLLPFLFCVLLLSSTWFGFMTVFNHVLCSLLFMCGGCVCVCVCVCEGACLYIFLYRVCVCVCEGLCVCLSFVVIV